MKQGIISGQTKHFPPRPWRWGLIANGRTWLYYILIARQYQWLIDLLYYNVDNNTYSSNLSSNFLLGSNSPFHFIFRSSVELFGAFSLQPNN